MEIRGIPLKEAPEALQQLHKELTHAIGQWRAEQATKATEQRGLPASVVTSILADRLITEAAAMVAMYTASAYGSLTDARELWAEITIHAGEALDAVFFKVEKHMQDQEERE